MIAIEGDGCSPCTKAKEIERLMMAIYGNGEPGIKTDIAVIKSKIESMPSSSALKVYMTVGAGLGVLGGIGLQLIFK